MHSWQQTIFKCLFINLVMNLDIKYLLSAYYLKGTILGAGTQQWIQYNPCS